MLRDCSSHNDYSQELPRFNQKRLEKCSTEKAQPYQPRPFAVEAVDPNRTRPNSISTPSPSWVKYFWSIAGHLDHK